MTLAGRYRKSLPDIVIFEMPEPQLDTRKGETRVMMVDADCSSCASGAGKRVSAEAEVFDPVWAIRRYAPKCDM